MDRRGLLGGMAVAAGLLFAMAPAAQADSLRLIGSGASFPFPLYSAWFKDFSKSSDATVDYQAKGSGAGIQDFTQKTVDFAASDAAMTDEQMSKVDGGVVLLPMTAGEIVLAYNLPGNPTGLKLPRDVYPEIFLGKIEKWNDPRIAKANPDMKLPDMPITVVRRSDSSGTNYLFTRHLSAISPDFKAGPGFGTSVQWPSSDKIVAAPKNDGVTATIKQTPGAIGYIEYGYAKLTKANSALLENKDGKFVAAGSESGAESLAGATLPDDMRAWIDDPEGEKAYPIVGFTWMLFYKDQDDKKAEVLRKMVEYGLSKGQTMSDAMGYIPLPDAVVAKVKERSKQIQ